MPSTKLPLGNTLTHEYDPKLKKLTIRGASSFPSQILGFAEDIEILDMSFGELSVLPDDFGRLRNLKTVFLSYNNFAEVPEVLSTCSSLVMVGMKSCKVSTFSASALPPTIQGITLTDNKLTSIPAAIGNMKSLKKLMLAGNQLADLPRELLGCDSLAVIRIGANNFEIAPDWLFTLPDLAWCSDAGNPFCTQSVPSQQKLPNISWDDIKIADKIGESSKNIVYRATDKSSAQEVAVKIYGGDVTTDGYSADEIRANILAASHPNLIGVIANLTDAPDQKQGLVMQLVPPNYMSLGQPPDFTTLTRDTFSPGQSYAVPFVVKVLRGVSSALQLLHSRGIMHGDVYAHNILVNKIGHAYLCDFGAASLYTPSLNHTREHIDVRGFGYLVDDLLTHISQKSIDAHPNVYEKLRTLRRACLHHTLPERPLFADIHRALQKM